MPFTPVRDIKIYYERRGSGPRLLYISGTGGDLRRKPNIFDDPLAASFEILAYDQRGLGQSSRNTYLKPDEREAALSLSRSLLMAKTLYEKGERDAGKIIEEVTRFIGRHPEGKIDYVKICDTTTMKDVNRLQGKEVIALAVRVGVARLIDNYVFGDPLELPKGQRARPEKRV